MDRKASPASALRESSMWSESIAHEHSKPKPAHVLFTVPPFPPQPLDAPAANPAYFSASLNAPLEQKKDILATNVFVTPNLLKIINSAEGTALSMVPTTRPPSRPRNVIAEVPRRMCTPSTIRPTPLIPLNGDPYLEHEFLMSYMPVTTPAPIEMIESFVQPAHGCPRFKFVLSGSKKNGGFGTLLNEGASLDTRLGETRAFSAQGYNCGKVEWQFYPETEYGWVQVGVAQRRFLMFNVAETHGFSRYKFDEGSAWLSHRIYVEKHAPVHVYLELDEQIGGTVVVMYNEMVMARMVGIPAYVYHVVVQAQGPVITGLEFPLESPLRAYNEEVQREAEFERSMGIVPSVTDTRSSEVHFRQRFRDKEREATRAKVRAREAEYLQHAREGGSQGPAKTKTTLSFL